MQKRTDIDPNMTADQWMELNNKLGTIADFNIEEKKSDSLRDKIEEWYLCMVSEIQLCRRSPVDRNTLLKLYFAYNSFMSKQDLVRLYPEEWTKYLSVCEAVAELLCEKKS